MLATVLDTFKDLFAAYNRLNNLINSRKVKVIDVDNRTIYIDIFLKI